jgi:hypothetical protein
VAPLAKGDGSESTHGTDALWYAIYILTQHVLRFAHSALRSCALHSSDALCSQHVSRLMCAGHETFDDLASSTGASTTDSSARRSGQQARSERPLPCFCSTAPRARREALCASGQERLCVRLCAPAACARTRMCAPAHSSTERLCALERGNSSCCDLCLETAI